MKNLMIYVDRTGIGGFNKEHNDGALRAARIQIDNSLDLGWRKDDILIITNFEFKYNGVEAIVLPNCEEIFCRLHNERYDWIQVKTWVTPILFERSILPIDEEFWMHDFDAFQIHPFTHTGSADVRLTTFGFKDFTNGGSMFFKSNAWDLFLVAKNNLTKYKDVRMRGGYKMKYNEEFAWEDVYEDKIHKPRLEKLNITYNYGMRFKVFDEMWPQADKPILVAHFHLEKKEVADGYHLYRAFCEGENPGGVEIVSGRLKKIFNDHGFCGQ